jgi:hypothetical protein
MELDDLGNPFARFSDIARIRDLDVVPSVSREGRLDVRACICEARILSSQTSSYDPASGPILPCLIR